MCIYNHDKSCRLDKHKSSFLMWTYPFCFKLNLGKDESQFFPVLFYEAGGCAVKGNNISLNPCFLFRTAGIAPHH